MESNNVELIRSAYAAFSRGDIPYILSILAPGVEWIEPGAPAIPTGGTYHGRDGVASFFQRLAETTEVLTFEPRDYVSGGDIVGVFGYWRARVKKTNRVFEGDWAMSFRVLDGKIARFQSYLDTAVQAAAHTMAASA